MSELLVSGMNDIECKRKRLYFNEFIKNWFFSSQRKKQSHPKCTHILSVASFSSETRKKVAKYRVY